MAIRYLSLGEVLTLYQRVMEIGGGTRGLRDIGALQAAVAQPRMKFGGQELYPTMADKAAALAYSLVKNHAFLDGNKRIAHAAMEVFLVLNGYMLQAPVHVQEKVMLDAAACQMNREALTAWVRAPRRRRTASA